MGYALLRDYKISIAENGFFTDELHFFNIKKIPYSVDTVGD
jgi:hypothetical protein